MLAEIEMSGGVAQRVSAFVELRDVAGLQQRAGFALPMADREVLTVSYGDPLKLLEELRGMGAANALMERSRRGLKRSVSLRALDLYGARFALPDGTLPATFELYWLAGRRRLRSPGPWRRAAPTTAWMPWVDASRGAGSLPAQLGSARFGPGPPRMRDARPERLQSLLFNADAESDDEVD